MFTRDSVIISYNIKTPLTSISRAVGNILKLTFNAPYNLTVEFKITNRLELNWKLDGFVSEQRYYCSETPIDPLNLPVPKAILAGDVRTYVDTDIEIGKTYYVCVGSMRDAVEKISNESNVLAWGPSLIASAWYDFSDEHTVTVVDNAISKIMDKSGNEKHLSQSTVSKRPLYLTLENGMRVAKFDGVNDFLGANIALIGTTHSLFIVFKPTIKSAIGSLFGQWAFGAVGRFSLITNQSSAGVITQGRLNPFNSTATGGSGSEGFANDVSISDEVTVIGSISSAGTNNWKLYKNGSSTGSATITSVYSINSSIGSASAAEITNPYDGYVCEVVIVNSAINTETQKKLESYLSQKWGIKVQN